MLLLVVMIRLGELVGGVMGGVIGVDLLVVVIF